MGAGHVRSHIGIQLIQCSLHIGVSGEQPCQSPRGMRAMVHTFPTFLLPCCLEVTEGTGQFIHLPHWEVEGWDLLVVEPECFAWRP